LPGHQAHAFIDRFYFGKAYWKIHKQMDYAWHYWKRDHRRFGHDWVSAVAIARECYPDDENAVEAALLHIQVDDACTADPEYKRMLEMWAKCDAKERRREKSRKKSKKKIRVALPEM